MAFIAYISNIQLGESINDVEFTIKKESLIGKLGVFTISKKGPDWFILKNSNLLFHISWLNHIVNMDNEPEIKVIRFTNYITRLVKIDENRRYYIDYISNKRITSHVRPMEIYSTIDISEMHVSIFDTRDERFTCSKCGALETDVCAGNIEKTICTACYDKMKKICSVCGVDFIEINQNENTIFNHSIGTNITACNDCISNMHTCTCCKERFFESEVTVIEGDAYCNKCVGAFKVKKCYVCKEYFNADSSNIKDLHTGRSICNVCSLESRLSSKPIKEYGFKPEPIFYGKKEENSLFMGVELEIVTPSKREGIAKFIQYNINDPEEFIYCKFDRSIGIGKNGRDGEAGFEIVTHPFSYPWIKSTDGVFKLSQIMNLTKYGCKSYNTNTCGMHVHLSKRAFTNTHLYKFLYMIFNNKDFMIKISDRKDMAKVDKYSSFTPETDLRILADNRSNSGDTTGRHRAVNLACEHTVEVRIFRGTLNFDRFMKNLEFCKSLYDFTHKCSNDNLTVENYKEFLKANQNEFNRIYNHVNTMENK